MWRSQEKFSSFPETFDFPKAEEVVKSHWKEIDAFQTSLKQSHGKKPYTFYDGPPFATGLPHYGHILAGTIKDTVTRYAHQTGHHVERRFGWDCHGLPVEHEIDKKLGIKGPEDVKKIGIAAYNNECRKIVDRYSGEWKTIMERLGRWIDFERDYKTMYPSFMESVWWVTKKLFEKDRIYHGYRVMPYSTACATPLSNFEANQNYKDVADPSVVVCFPLVDDPSVEFLAWTTTPWTLVSNLSLIVNAKSQYVKVEDNKSKKKYILMESRMASHFGKKRPCTVLEKFTGEQLKKIAYVPCFDYFRDWAKQGAFRVLTDDYVSDSDGTGVVQAAPAFGEDDYRVSIANNICRAGNSVPCPIDSKGCFTNEIPDFSGMYFKDVDKLVIKSLKSRNRIFWDGTINHNYPFCWRSDTPLMYRIVPSWFLKVTDIVPSMVKNSLKTRWVPDSVKMKRFQNWLENARDWNISRNRYWGTPIPFWTNNDFSEVVCVGSMDELYQLSGVKINDLHREFVDDIKIPSRKNPGTYLTRVSDVFDCWFESGSMPYAQIHYPFENEDIFKKGFPADFIAEGIDQTRGWFYTLLVLSTSLFDQPPFQNLIVNGLVLASDGQKMSKRKQNYPDPMNIVNKYGADVLRLYLINSPVVRADFLKFQEAGVHNLVKEVFLPWYNSCRYLMQNVGLYCKVNNTTYSFNEEEHLSELKNYMDRWIVSYTQSLISFVHEEMKCYRLYTVVPKINEFLDNLTKWYIRFNRTRLKGHMGAEEQKIALSTLFMVQLTMAKMFSPFVPFFTEYLFQSLVHYDSKLNDSATENPELIKSVHFQMLPTARKELIDNTVEKTVKYMQNVVDLARIVREKNVVPIKFRLKELVIMHTDHDFLDAIRSMENYILEDLNVEKLTLSSDLKSYGVQCKVLPDYQRLGERFKSQVKDVRNALTKLSIDDLERMQKPDFSFVVGDACVLREDIKFQFSVQGDERFSAYSDGEVVVLLDVTKDEGSAEQFATREIINRIQKLRKKANVVPTDDIEIVCYGDDSTMEFLRRNIEFIHSSVKMPIRIVSEPQITGMENIAHSSEEIMEKCVNISLYK